MSNYVSRRKRIFYIQLISFHLMWLLITTVYYVAQTYTFYLSMILWYSTLMHLVFCTLLYWIIFRYGSLLHYVLAFCLNVKLVDMCTWYNFHTFALLIMSFKNNKLLIVLCTRFFWWMTDRLYRHHEMVVSVYCNIARLILCGLFTLLFVYS